MKKLLSFVAVAFMSVACGSDTPDVVAKNCHKAYFEGDLNKYTQCFYFKSEDVKQKHIEDLISNINRSRKMVAGVGGIKSIEASILREFKDDNGIQTAEIQAIITANNGEIHKLTNELKKVGNNWYAYVYNE